MPPTICLDGCASTSTVCARCSSTCSANAVKFTTSGCVSLHARSTADGPSAVRLHFEVADTGTGIAPEHLESIFQPFEQVGDIEQRAGGTGLGLAISRELVHAMGGDIHVESRLGAGSVFRFEVPAPVVRRESALAPAQPVIRGYEGPRKKVLVVDDVVENRAVLVDVLTHLGFEVSQARNGEEGMRLAQADPMLAQDNVTLDLCWRRAEGTTARLPVGPVIHIGLSGGGQPVGIG